MRPVVVTGIGKTAFGAFPDRDLRSLAVEAGQKALENAHAQPGQVEAFYLGNFAGPSFVGQNHLAPYIASRLGITGVPATRFEAACASSGAAFYQGVQAVASGNLDNSPTLTLGATQLGVILGTIVTALLVALVRIYARDYRPKLEGETADSRPTS